MLPQSLVQEIDRLWKEGKLSQRAIAARLRVSHGTVNAVARGLHAACGRERPADHERPAYHAQPQRCRRCGYFVYVPCLICEARGQRERRRVLRLVGKLQNSRHAPRALTSAMKTS